MNKEEFITELNKLKDEVLHQQIQNQIDGMIWLNMFMPVDYIGIGREVVLERIRKEFEIYTKKNLMQDQEQIKQEIRLERQAEEAAQRVEHILTGGKGEND